MNDAAPATSPDLDDPPIPIGPAAIAEAAARIAPHARRTPVFSSHAIDERCGATVVFKCENFQRVGAFKFRGAMNAVLQLGAEARARGVITHSSGNHAQALALAAKLVGAPAVVVMPRTAPAVKRAATEGYGARIVTCEPTQAAREAAVAEEVARYGLTLVHPYDDWAVIAGQGTAARELIEDAGPLDLIVTPCGGGGLLSGSALTALGVEGGPRVFGAEPLAADDARRSLAEGRILPSGDPKTIADGLRTSLGRRTFAVIRRHVAGIAAATEAEILDAMRLVYERLKIVIEPSSAVPLAALLNGALDAAARGRRVGVILTGGNVDLGPLFEALAGKLG